MINFIENYKHIFRSVSDGAGFFCQYLSYSGAFSDNYAYISYYFFQKNFRYSQKFYSLLDTGTEIMYNYISNFQKGRSKGVKNQLAKKNLAAKDLALAALLTALSMLITYSPLKLYIPPFSATLGSHVPTMLALFISPVVTLLTVIGSCIGFAFVTGNFIVVLRAASHIVFAMMGAHMIKKMHLNIFFVTVITGLVHALCEGVIVYLLTPLFTPDAAVSAVTYIAFFGTLIQHGIDAAITFPILMVLKRSKFISVPINTNAWRKMPVQRGI